MATIHAQHIEPARQVLGETAEGALRIARYHFYRSSQIELVEEGAATVARNGQAYAVPTA
ncbi:MAG TPA: hypothetical protein PKI20_00645 [Verrucomicrobiota bacterium]|jgi:hypothetical protein|nr:hypothetical protein [Verrucomicrobiota bacterium]HQL76606.1 hypothetical protein [Verrucomicrobiota bacterium]